MSTHTATAIAVPGPGAGESWTGELRALLALLLGLFLLLL